MVERRNIGLAEETEKEIGVVEAEKEMEVEARERRIDNWNRIGSEKREMRRMMGWGGVAGEAGDRSAVRTG
jgi:hypothetical protein